MTPENTETRPDLLSSTPFEVRERIRSYVGSVGAPAYRADQIVEWLYDQYALDFDDMTNLPKSLRADLARAFRLPSLVEDHVSVSEDGTVKHLWALGSGERVESVLIPTEDRLTLCISSQAGCAMGCTFCATGWGGFRGQLSAGEIVAQYAGSQRWATANEMGRITNVVFMGMGEPLSNRKAVHPALTILNEGYGLGARRITVSTVGVIPGILELARRPEQFRLALSLHAPTSELRAELIPLEKRYPLPELIEALEEFNRAGGRRITFEYTMIRDVNDEKALAAPLADLAERLQAFVNLIPFNPIPYQDWTPSSVTRIRFFRETLEARGVPVAVRETRGRDIDAACGQLRAHALEEAPG